MYCIWQYRWTRCRPTGVQYDGIYQCRSVAAGASDTEKQSATLVKCPVGRSVGGARSSLLDGVSRCSNGQTTERSRSQSQCRSYGDLGTSTCYRQWRFGRALISGGAMTSRQLGHFQVTKVVGQVVRCKRQRSKGARSFWGPQARSPDAIFSKKKLTTLLVVAVKTQAANAADCFTVKIKQIKRSDMVTFLSSVHAVTEAKQ